MRKFSFRDDHYYHVYNRGTDKRKIFLRHGEYARFIRTISSLLINGTAQQKIITRKSLAFSKKLSFIAYCLMPNHYHFLVMQREENGISEFMHHLNTSYTKYFNTSHTRTGRLFEYTFRAVEIESTEQLIHVSRYIHLNPILANLTKDLNKYQWSSYLDYIGKRAGKLCEKDEILGIISEKDSMRKYEEFVLDHIDYAKHIKQLENVTFD